jgi:hypothetical protein
MLNQEDTVRLFGLICQAMIEAQALVSGREGMMAMNAVRADGGYALAYHEESFVVKNAEDLRSLALGIQAALR